MDESILQKYSNQVFVDLKALERSLPETERQKLSITEKLALLRNIDAMLRMMKHTRGHWFRLHLPWVLCSGMMKHTRGHWFRLQDLPWVLSPFWCSSYDLLAGCGILTNSITHVPLHLHGHTGGES